MAETLVSGHSGALLPPLVLAYAGAAFAAVRRWGRSAHVLASAGGSLAVAAACLAAVSVALVTWFGFAQPGDPQGAAWVYLVYAACAIVGAARDRHAVVAWAGAALLLAAVVQGVMFRYAAHWRWCIRS